MQIIDSHHHLWKYNSEDYGWMDDSMEILRKDYLPSDLKTEIEKADVDGTVVVQARQTIEETAWLLKLAEKHDFIKGVVGWVDLRSPELPDQLEQFADHPKFVGVRHVIHDEPDVDFMLKSKFLRGIEQLSDYDLTFDLLLFPKHLSNATELVSQFPAQRFVLDHMAKPFIKAGIRKPWKEDIAMLAEEPNVYCKISGMITEADLQHWKYTDFIPYMKVVLENFGTDRIMIGSDWPVCKLGATYEDVLNIPKQFFSDLDEIDQEKIFSQNCDDFYKLDI